MSCLVSIVFTFTIANGINILVIGCRRDSFITHRAFCDALAEESARVNTSGGHMSGNNSLALQGGGGPLGMNMGGPHSPGRSSLSRQLMGSSSTMMDTISSASRCGIFGGVSSNLDSSLVSASSSRPRLSLWLGSGPAAAAGNAQISGTSQFPLNSMDPFGSGSTSMASLFGSPDSFDGPKPLSSISGMPGTQYSSLLMPGVAGLSSFPDMGGNFSGLSELGGFSGWPDKSRAALSSGGLGSGNAIAGGFSGVNNNSSSVAGLASLPSVSSLFSQAHASASAQTSATALLQKAAQMGATASNTSLLKGFGNIGTSSWPSSSGSHLMQAGLLGPMNSGLSPSNAVQNHSSYMVQHEKEPASSGFGNIMQGSSNNNEALIKSGPMDAAGAASIQELTCSMAPPANSYSGSSMGSTPTSISHMFGINSVNSENRNPNSPAILSIRDQQLNARSSGGQQQAKLALMGLSNSVPKSEDGVTRDFLGVRGVNTLVGAQDHTATLAKSLSQRDSASVVYPLGMEQMHFSPRDSLRSLHGISGPSPSSPVRSWTDNV